MRNVLGQSGCRESDVSDHRLSMDRRDDCRLQRARKARAKRKEKKRARTVEAVQQE